MKRNKFLGFRICVFSVGIICIMSLLSCEKWLDVRPSTQTSEEDQFSSEEGYMSAIIGIYQGMTSTTSYGKDMTYGMLDVLAQLYENKQTETDYYGRLARYDYTYLNNELLISNIWQKQYNLIAQANYVLRDIDKNQTVFTEDNYNIVKGEALALRAMLHFDLLRMFAPALIALENSEQTTIPIMTEFTVNPKRAASFQTVINAVTKDLLEAEDLLAVNPEIDQINENTGNVSFDLFGMFRQNRLNYWAVKGLLARVYLYNNNKSEALKYAKQVIESEKFKFINGSTFDANPASPTSNVTFSSEHLFSLYHSQLKTFSDDYFKTETAKGESTDYFTRSIYLQSYYEDAREGYTDIRGFKNGKRWNAFEDATVYTTKYYVGTNVTNVNQKLIPILRLAEMHYIAAESSSSIGEALSYLNPVRSARLIPELTQSEINTNALLENEIFKEYRKEFYAEGQLWFYYKRKNYLTIENSVGGEMNNEKYVFPIPNKELEFGLN